MSRLSPESILELSQLLHAMEAIRKGDRSSTVPLTDQSEKNLPATKRVVKKVAEDKKLPVIEKKESQAVEVMMKKPVIANARPELRDFKKQQQKARRIARDAEFFQMQSASPYNHSSDSTGMPVAELILKAPNSSDVIRAILGPEGMTIVSKDKGKEKNKNKDIDFNFSALSGDESLPLPSPSFPSLHTGGDESLPLPSSSLSAPHIAQDSTPRTMDIVDTPLVGKLSNPSSTLEEGTISSSSSSGVRLQWQAVHQYLSAGDTVAAFSLVLERGELEDLAHIMKLVGPRPHVSKHVKQYFLFISCIICLHIKE